MKIAFDISQIVYGTGVSVYTKNLIKNLLLVDKEDIYILFGGSLRRRIEIEEFIRSLNKPTVMGKVYPFPPFFADFLWNKLHKINIESLIGKIDVFHSSDWTQPPSKAFTVTTVHDLVPILYPQWSHPKIVSVHLRRMDWVKKEVDKIIAPSETTKKDLVSLGFASEKITVIPEAPSKRFERKKPGDISAFRKKYNLRENYLLVIGVTPRKNLKRIVKAFTKLNLKEYELVVVGYKDSAEERERGVKYLGFLKDEEMPLAYSGARLFVYPSLYEGFGLPILESFACGTPVLTSNLGSMKEVAGDAAIVVDPHDYQSIAQGMLEGLENREKLIEKGKIQVKKYSWRKTAKKTLKLYQESLN